MSIQPPVLTSFPLLSGVQDGRLGWSTGNASVREVMLNILLTRPGERLMRPEFGAGLRDFVHHPNNQTTRALIADATRKSIARWEPRVNVEEVHVEPDTQSLSVVNLSIRYRLRQDGSAGNLDLSLDLGSVSR
jgi:uncharacterized protein